MSDSEKIAEWKKAIDEGYAAWRQHETMRDAAPVLLAALKLVASSENWRCFEDDEWDAVAEGRKR